MTKRNVSRIAPALLWLVAALGGALAAPVIGAPASGAAQLDAPYKILSAPYEIIEADFDPFGGYVIRGRKPRGFDDFDNFTLDIAGEPARGRDIKVVGGVVTSSGGHDSTVFQLERMNLSVSKLSFTTETVGGVGYEFEGRFLRGGALSRFSRKVSVLEGVLTKYVGGAKVAERRLRFNFVVWKARYYVRPAEK